MNIESSKNLLSQVLLATTLISAGLVSAASATNAGETAGTLSAVGPAVQELQSCVNNNDGKSQVLVTVEKLQSSEGNIRIQIYSDNPDEFLAKGKKLLRLVVPVKHEPMQVCVPLPGPGEYAMFVMHDSNANGKPDFMTEGFGFSNNPKLMLAPPDHDETLFAAKAGVLEMTISLIYLINVEQKKHRKRRRR